MKPLDFNDEPNGRDDDLYEYRNRTVNKPLRDTIEDLERGRGAEFDDKQDAEHYVNHRNI